MTLLLLSSKWWNFWPFPSVWLKFTSHRAYSNSNSVISHIQRYPPTLSNSAYVPEANLILLFLRSAVLAILSFLSHSRFFTLFIYFLAYHLALGIPFNRKRKQRSQNEARKYIITWTAVNRNGKIWDNITVDSPLINLSVFSSNIQDWKQIIL